MNMRKTLNFRIIFVGMIIGTLAASLIAETLYVDGINGNDNSLGTKNKPLKTINKAAMLVNDSNAPGPTKIKIGPGMYNLTETVIFENERAYTEKNRLVIEASVLPDDPKWKPTLMPIILSVENSLASGMSAGTTETVSFKIKTSHATINGLKFHGNASLNNWHACIERIGKKLDDLLITQCMFIGNPDTLNIYCALIGTGDRFIVDHCVFYNCHASAVYWDGLESVSGKGCAMRYSIVNGAYQSAVWTCQTDENFEFHHNIVTNSEYLWIRTKSNETQKYRLYDCIITGNKHYSGYGLPTGPTSQTGIEITFDEKNVIKKGRIVLGKDKNKNNYLHPLQGTLGSNIGAGLFKKTNKGN